MKKINLLIGASIISMNIFAQQNPTANSPAAPGQNGTNARDFWSRAGNSGVGANNSNNIFGTAAGFNSPIYTQTDGVTRMRLNGTLTTPIWSVNQNVSGYIGIDPTGFFNTNVPQTMLHLHSSNVPVFTTGWRRWMKTGIFIEENSDAMYVGLKTETNNNRSDAVINWSDDYNNGPGPDKLRFIFTGSTPTGDGVAGASAYDANGLNGYEYMRMQPYPAVTNSANFPIGHIGIGPDFTNALPPQNRLHINAENNLATFIEISNTQGTGQTGNDGLHIGYPTTIPTFLTAQINQKENDNLVMLTNQGERIRVSHIGNVSTANMNPGGLANDLTRVSISHNPLTPVTRPLSLLHLGYNTQGATNDGWRNWMDVGMYTSQGSDNVFIGLKKETAPFGDRFDAVLNWGDNQINSGLPPNNGPDNFRFIFTSTNGLTGGGTFPATSADGLEALRMTPTSNTGVFTGIGGEPTSGLNLYSGGTQNPNNTLEVNSWGPTTNPGGSSGLRLTNLTIASPTVANPGTGVLSVDANGDVIYVQGGGGLGNVCGATPQNPLPNNWEIPTNNFNYRFIAPTGTNPWGTNYVGIGTTCAPTANFDVNSVLTSNNPNAVTAVNVSQTNLGNSATFSGVAFGIASDVNALNNNNIGVGANARNAKFNYGVYSTANAISSGTSNQRNVGVYAEASRASENFAMRGRSISNPALTTGLNVGGWFSAENNQTRIGVMGDVNGAQFILPTLFPFNHAIGVYGWNPSAGSTEYAGYFEGKVNVNGALTVYGAPVIGSDASLKTNIDSISNASAILNQIEAVSFYYDTTNVNGMRFSSQKQYGVIAQQVETVLPELINNNYKPAMVDSAGTVVYPAKSFKTVNYNAFIGLLIKANQEQQVKIDSLTKKLNAKDSIQDARLTALENAIAQCCSNAAARNNNSNINQLDVELSDKDAIVLNQNVPNPFAEQTTITYNVPSSVEKAQLIFFNSNGQVIQTVDIKTRGKGKVNVFASDLSSGLYHYTLVADGKVVDSKKMVRE